MAAPAGRMRRVLDAGCCNGMLAYRSHLLGNRVIGVTFKENEVAGCRRLFNNHLAIPEEQLAFHLGNLYELDFADESFDEIICSEVLEHLRDDAGVCRSFWRLLNIAKCPGCFPWPFWRAVSTVPGKWRRFPR